MRAKKNASPENHERWLVSYADFITLLFAFFVVMFASAQGDKGSAKAVSESVREALEHGQFSAAMATLLLGRGKFENSKLPPYPDRTAKQTENLPPATAPPADLWKSLEKLRGGLDTELKDGKVQVRLVNRGLVISLREAAFFASGDDTIDPSGYPILAKVAAVVQALPNPVRLEGHTDSVPIHTPRFRSNWELSAARSIAMLELLSGKFGVARERMAVAGYAENAPTDTNETEEGRSHNRRVDVVVLSAEAVKSEPQAAQVLPAPKNGPSGPHR